MRPSSPLQIKTIRGAPIKVYRGTLTPVARVLSAVQHRATIRADRFEGSGWGFAHTLPIALIEERNGIKQTLPIPNQTRKVLGQMALLALVFPMICAAVIAVARWLQDLDEHPG